MGVVYGDLAGSRIERESNSVVMFARETMTDQKSGTRLAAILWFVAAALAFIAAGISFLPPRDFNWSVAAGGLFSLAMGVSAWSRSRPGPPSP